MKHVERLQSNLLPNLYFWQNRIWWDVGYCYPIELSIFQNPRDKKFWNTFERNPITMLLFAIHVCYAWLIWFNIPLSKLLPYWMILLCWILQIMFTMRTMDIIDSVNIEPMLLLTMRFMTWLILDQCHNWYCDVLSIVKCLPFHLELVIKSGLAFSALLPWILWHTVQYCG